MAASRSPGLGLDGDSEQIHKAGRYTGHEQVGMDHMISLR
jgi:hypothetical protein